MFLFLCWFYTGINLLDDEVWGEIAAESMAYS